MTTATKSDETQSTGVKVEIMANGPLLVHGTISITDKEGNTSVKDKTTAFCRCGAATNKPYCDGSHRKINFEG